MEKLALLGGQPVRTMARRALRVRFADAAIAYGAAAAVDARLTYAVDILRTLRGAGRAGAFERSAGNRHSRQAMTATVTTLGSYGVVRCCVAAARGAVRPALELVASAFAVAHPVSSAGGGCLRGACRAARRRRLATRHRRAMPR